MIMQREMRQAVLIAMMLPQVGLAQAPAVSQQSTPPSTMPPSVQSRMFAQSYLKPDQLPNSAVLVPPPPASGSEAMKRDTEGATTAVAQQGGARWKLAVADAELMAPDAIGTTFSCASGFAISAKATPALSALLSRAAANLAMSTMAAKRKYQRARPFMVNGKPTCTPELEAVLRKDGSYPSGHSAIGFGTGLILAEAIPSRATELVARGRVFGDSRRICNVHWLSDIEEGRFMAAATFARLNADPAFQKDLAAARSEADAALAANSAPGRDCVGEAGTIAATR
ncbi:MAG: phosphatase PAP2 family protein [Sphingobium sp.]